MPVPLPILDSILVQETLLERDKLAVHFLDTLGRLDELLHRALLVQEEVEDATQPLHDRRLRLGALALPQLLQSFLELLLRIDLLHVELRAGLLELLEGLAETGEVDGLHDVGGSIVEDSVTMVRIQQYDTRRDAY